MEALAYSCHHQKRGGIPCSGSCQGRSRGGRGSNSYRKDTTSCICIERRITASDRYHIIVTPLYGIFWAGVYYVHWDDDNIKMMVDGASHIIHFSSDLKGGAYK